MIVLIAHSNYVQARHPNSKIAGNHQSYLQEVDVGIRQIDEWVNNIDQLIERLKKEDLIVSITKEEALDEQTILKLQKAVGKAKGEKQKATPKSGFPIHKDFGSILGGCSHTEEQLQGRWCFALRF